MQTPQKICAPKTESNLNYPKNNLFKSNMGAAVFKADLPTPLLIPFTHLEFFEE